MKAGSIALAVVTAALAAGCALGLLHLLCIIDLRIPFDPNEGWNAAFARLAMTTGSPYPPQASLMIDNYPPLSFYVVAALARFGGDPIFVGRWLALASLLAVAAGIAAAALRMGCGRCEAAFAALFFLGVVMATTGYAGMDDPQMLGHAIAIGGLLLVLREPRTPRAVLGAALLFTVAFLVKHNLVVLPAALALWLALLDRRLAVTFAASGIVFALIAMGLFKQAFGVGLLHQIESARTYSFANLGNNLRTWLAWSFVPLAGAVLLFAIGRRDRHAMLCVIYAALATLAGTYFLGGAGVDFNAMFDADIALALSAGVLMNRLEGGLRRSAAALAYAVPFLIALGSLDADWRSADFWSHPGAQEQAVAAQQIAMIRDAKGPVICEMLSLCLWADKPAEVDVFNLGQAYLTGARSDRDFVRAIDARHYALIELESGEPFPFTQAVQAALARGYRIVRQDDDRAFYAPNRAP